MRQFALPLWTRLQAATDAPDTADLEELLTLLEESLQGLESGVQLQVAAEAIQQLAAVVYTRSEQIWETLMAATQTVGVVMPMDAFDRYVRQTMAVDFEAFIEPLSTLPRADGGRSPSAESEPETAETPETIVGELDRDRFLQALDEQMQQHPGFSEAEVMNQVFAIAHEEDVSRWVGAIAGGLADHPHQSIPLVHLQHTLNQPLSHLWLGALLGGFHLEQRGDFYDTTQIWIREPGDGGCPVTTGN